MEFEKRVFVPDEVLKDKAGKFDPYKRVSVDVLESAGESPKVFDPYERVILKDNGTSKLEGIVVKDDGSFKHYEKLIRKDDGTYKITCINEHLEGTTHPATGVPFVKKIIEDIYGNKIEVVVPVFDSLYDAWLPKDLLEASDKQQAKECNKQLKEAVENNPDLASKFTKEQLEQIKNGDTPDGYTWHHNEEVGKMQLVDSDIHNKTGHTGGKSIWGGGQENR